MTLHTQFLTMGTMLLGGMYLGFANETFRRFVPLWRRSVFLVYSFEVLFWLMQTAVLFYALYRTNAGELRVYLLFALISGFLLYKLLFQTLYVTVLNALIRMVKKTILTLYRLCMIPIVYISKGLWRIVMFFLRLIFRLVQFLVCRIVHPLVRWLLPKKMYKFISQKGVLCSTIVSTRLKKIVSFFRNKRR